MKQSHISLVAVGVALMTVSLAHGQESTTTASTTEESVFSTFRENITEIKETVQERVENHQATLDARVQERIINLAANISNRFDGIIARLQNITDRLNKRIEKEMNDGKDVMPALASLQAAQSALNNAKAQMRDIDETVVGAVGSTDPRARWQDARAKFLNAREYIRTAHTELRNTIINLKTAPQVTTETTASSTEEITN
jgi:hypothetical protein